MKTAIPSADSIERHWHLIDAEDAVLGRVADVHGIDYVYSLCAYLPLMGVLAIFLPDLDRPMAKLANA